MYKKDHNSNPLLLVFLNLYNQLILVLCRSFDMFVQDNLYWKKNNNIE
jgi:hypothetical protein